MRSQISKILEKQWSVKTKNRKIHKIKKNNSIIHNYSYIYIIILCETNFQKKFRFVMGFQFAQ